MITINNAVIIPNNLEYQLSIWYTETIVKPNADQPRL